MIDNIWSRKSNYKTNKFYTLPINSIGQTYKQKINSIVSEIKKNKADFQFITSSENNAWLLNIRGRDSNYTPIPHSYILIDQFKNLQFFCDLKKISPSFKKKFNKISFLDIRQVGLFLSKLTKSRVAIDNSTCSMYFENIISKKNTIVNRHDPINYLKSIKSKIEIENIKKAHIYDGAALTKYLIWLKKKLYQKKSM